MSTALFHINDHCLQIQQADSLVQSQGYAWLRDDQVVFDFDSEDSAVKHCRIEPQQINSLYWQQCEQTAIPANSANMRHAADLIWQHLSQLRQQYGLRDLVFVTPSHYQSSNLQLLLGIARTCQLNVQALVNKAVVAIQQAGMADGEYYHLDVQLHQTVCSVVQVNSGQVKLGNVEVIQNVGIQAMQDALLKAIQANFIRNDRFDPLHHAATEQQMFDQLASNATDIANTGKASISVEHQQRLHTTSIDAKQWQACLAPFTKTLISAGAKYSQVFIDLNKAFDDCSLKECDEAGFTALHTGAVDASTLVKHVVEAGSEEGSLVYKTQLPSIAGASQSQANGSASMSEASASKKSATPIESKAAPNASAPLENGVTHLLFAGKAVAVQNAIVGLDNNQLSLDYSEQGNLQSLLSNGTLFVVNDDSRTVLSQLKANDRLGSNLADGVITAIEVL